MRLGMAGLRTGSSTLTGEEKSEQARPSELMGTDPLLTECSLESKIQELLSAVKTQNNLQSLGLILISVYSEINVLIE